MPQRRYEAQWRIERLAGPFTFYERRMLCGMATRRQSAVPIPEPDHPADHSREAELEDECKQLMDALAKTNAELQNALKGLKRALRLLKKLNALTQKISN